MARQVVLSLNAGSSSIKFAVHGVDGFGELNAVASGKIEGIGTGPHFIARGANREVLVERHWTDPSITYDVLLGEILTWLSDCPAADELTGIGHRVVHGGTAFLTPVLATSTAIEAMRKLEPLAPLHQPHNLAAIEAAMVALPGVPNVACFDTAFHCTQPDVATRLTIPRALSDEGIRRYGFHGLSYEYIAHFLEAQDPRLQRGRIIVAHLGNGASLCAMAGGRSVDTTMGFTALDGLMMGTRCGSLDPGVILYLQQHKGMSPEDIENLLYRQSGLLGVSGISADMRELLASPAQAAREAVELFVYRIAREAGALASSLGGLDGLIFTAGIGENAPVIRKLVGERLAWLGVAIDADANTAGRPVISLASSRVTVRIVPTDEETMIAKHTLAIVQPDYGAGTQ